MSSYEGLCPYCQQVECDEACMKATSNVELLPLPEPFVKCMNLQDLCERIVRNAIPTTDSGATCFVPRYQIDQLREALSAPQPPAETPITDERGHPMTYWGGKVQPPAEAQPVACDWPSCDCANGRAECGRKISQTPSAPVGVDLVAELKALRKAYVSLLETGRDRICDLGGECDPVDVMERGDIDLRRTDAALRAIAQQPAAVDDEMVERATTAYLQSRGTYEGEVPVDRDDIRAALTAAIDQARGKGVQS